MTILIENYTATENAGENAVFPASPHQERLWFMDQLEGGHHAVPLATDLGRNVDAEALQRAIDAVVATHEALRTGLRHDGTLLVQEIASRARVLLRVEPRELESVLAEELARPFDLSAPPLLRASLVGSTLLLVGHHAILDRASLRLLSEELLAVYEGRETAAPELHYADFSEWQRTMPENEQQELFLYWQYQLRDKPKAIELPTTNPRQASQTYTSGTVKRAFSPSVPRDFNTLYSAFAVLLHRYTHQDDLVIGTPLDLRADETARTIGPVTNLVALRARFAAEDTLADVLRRDAEMIDAARSHGALACEKLAQLLNPESDLTRTALFDVLFAAGESEDLNLGYGRYDLNVFVADGVCTITYNADLYDAAFVEQLARHYERVLDHVARASARVSEIELVDALDLAQLAQWNGEHAPWPQKRGIHQLFEEHAAQHPNDVALEFKDARLTYRELNEDANRLAHWLLEQGVTPESLVGLATERSMEMIVGILGIFKAGAGYVPLDPNHPAARMEQMVEDCGAAVVLTQSHVVDKLPLGSAQAFLLDRRAETLQSYPSTNPETQQQPENLAYVIYTSGSTGRPKGVMVEHRHVLSQWAAVHERYRCQLAQRVLSVCSFSFDVFVEEMCLSLFSGGTLVMTQDGLAVDSRRFWETIVASRISALSMPTSYFHYLCAELRAEEAEAARQSLQIVIVGGEALLGEHLARWQRMMGEEIAFWNGYGPTECTVFTTLVELSSAPVVEGKNPPIGRPLPNYECFVVDARGALCPPYVAGELWVGGSSVARGYLNREELSAERFIAPQRFGLDSERLYRTGDLVRYTFNGEIEYLGRMDQQVKINGFRVELGEIETQLLQSGLLKETTVIATGKSGEQQLVAYVVPAAPSASLVDDLRDSIRQSLPAYMIPGAFVVMETLPRNGNGKIDRRALPAPKRQAAAVHVAPSTPAEARVAKIWQSVLNLDREPSAVANFFDLGGHSLLALRIVTAVNAEFETQVPVRAVFENNTIRDLAAYLAARGGQASLPVAIPVADRTEPLPLSFAQQRLWFIDQLEGGSAQYNMPTALRLKGELRADVLQRSLDEIVARHEVLRSTYHARDGKGVQVVHKPRSVAIHRVDLTKLDAVERSLEVEELVRAEASLAFDLTADLMLRVQLVALAPNDHILLFTMHHIASDGWSMGVLVKELVALYEGHLLGVQADLAPLPIQYADYAAWQRNFVEGSELERQLAYWCDRLGDAPRVHSLPLDRPRPARQQFAGSHVTAKLDAKVLAALNRIAAENDATLFMVLQAAFALLVSRWSGAKDVVVGTPSAGRSHRDTEALIGFFVNTLVLRTEIAEDVPFPVLLVEARKNVLDAFSHPDVPFEMLVDELRPERSLSHAPIYQLVFSLQNNERVALQLPELEIGAVESDHETAKFDLSVAAGESAAGLNLTWNYAVSLFEAATIERLAESFVVLLEGIAVAPESRLSQLPIVTPKDVETWRGLQPALRPTDTTVVTLFESQARRRPSSIAIESNGTSLTYAELNARANRFAAYLRANGIGRETIVGIRMERSPEMVASALGILKAGAAYLPLDPSYPNERLDFLIADAQPALVVTRELFGSIDFDAYAAADVDPEITPDNLCYVLYTSGSTGQPKGVMVPHRGVVNYLAFAASEYFDEKHAGAVMSSTLSFDATVTTFLGPLVRGKKLVLLPEAQEAMLDGLAKHLFESQEPWVFKLTPAHLAMLAHSSRTSHMPHTIVVGGEQLTVDALEKWKAQLLPWATFVNEYGPTETVVGCSAYRVESYEDLFLPHCATAVSIGKPIRNTSLYVLDQHRQRVPVGAVGELYIGGSGVARGYLNRPELTAERFVECFGERVYKTGDLVRLLPDGNLVFVGRSDEQVKIRGFRIEPDEIRAKLVELPGVQDALVVARGEGNEKRLVAYVTGDANADALRAQLRLALPEYMVPSAFVVLESFPLTTNGKIDRKALPEPEWQRGSQYVAPRNETEEQLAAIWAQLLKLERVGVEDNFFAIGGDSILSIQAVSRANQLGIGITTRQLFEHQTIAALAAQASRGVVRDMPQEPATGSVSLLPIQRELLAEDPAVRNHVNQSVLLETPEGFDAGFLRAMVAALYQRHDALRLRFQGEEAVHVALSEEMLDAAAVIEPMPANVTERCNQWQQSFDLETGPLFRAIYFEPGRLFLVAHHIVVDGVSWRILLADIEQAWRQYTAGEPIALAPKTSSFQQWGAALAEYAQSPELQQEKAYWLAQYAHEAAELPVDRVVDARPANATSKRRRVRLDVAATQALLQRCAPVYRTTINELLLAGVYLGFRKWTGAEGLRIALEGHGREALFEQLDTTQTVGWFTTVYPLTLHSDGDGVANAIKSIKEEYRALPNHGIGFGVLRHLAQDRELAALAGAHPPQLVFNYLGQFDQSVNHETALQAAAESTGASISPERARPYRLGLTGLVANGCLEFVLDYSEREYEASTIANVAGFIEDGLRAVIDHCLMIERGDFTPSDFPLATVTQETLDAWQQAYPNLARLYPATAMQQGMFFHGQLDRSAYVTQIYPVFHGELATQHFRRAWELVCNRHDIFRTAFVGEDQRLHQLVVSDVALPWQEFDWRHLSAEEQHAKFAQYRTDDKAAGFDFTRAPLQRIALFRLSADRWQMLWTHHHMLLDGWCAPLVYREVMLAYQHLVRGEEVRFAEAPVYEKYIQWLQRQDAEQARAFWRNQLLDVEGPTPLAIDKLPKDGRSGSRERVLALTLAETQRLEAFAKASHTTVNTLLQLAWSYVLHRYSGESRVLFGAITSGRPAGVPGIEEMIGLFINTIPVKVAFEPGATTASLLATLHRDFQQSQEHGWMPLTEIQKQSSITAGVPMFDSLLVFENYPMDAAMAVDTQQRGSQLRIESGGNDEQTSYKLTLLAAQTNQLRIRCSYLAENFAEATVERMLAHLGLVLRALPEQESIADVDVVTDEERASFALWNRTEGEYPRNKTIHQLFEERAARTPDAVAVTYGEAFLTYGELDARANRLAHLLVAKNVAADSLVGVYADRSLEMVVAMVAILKAGGAYVPLDPSYPPARLGAMIEDSGARVVITQQQLAGALDGLPCDVIVAGDAIDAPSHAPDVRVAPENLAYVMFTSGSTGKPKGVMVEHLSIVRLIINNDYLPLNEETRMLQASSCSFDVATLEIWGSLVNGGTLVLYPERYVDMSVLNQELAARRVNTMWLTSGLFDQWTQQLPEYDGLQYVLAGGDVVNPRAVERVYRAWPHVQVINGYGPTENTTFTTCHRIPADSDWTRSVSLGKPINGTTTYVLTQGMRPLPVGAIGELFTGGDGVARGYWQRPELTAEKFVVNPETGERLYKTGDLVRWLPDGTLDFVGRIDDQVKVRGFRIELGEIEAQLLLQPEVREAVVVAKKEGAVKRVVAYLVLHEKAAGVIEKLERELRTQLPDYMVPSAFVVMDALPINPNGKIDRRALPDPEWTSNSAYVAPRNETEAKLAEIWAKLLKLERVGIDDNFFAIGGDSILSIQAVSRANQAGVGITTRQLFENPTIAALAALAQSNEQRAISQEAVTGEVALLPIQREFLETAGPLRHHFNQSLLMQTPEGFDAKFLREVVTALHARHDALRLRFDADNRAEHGEARIDESAIVEPMPENLTERCTHHQQSFDLATGPLFKAVYFEPGRLFLVAHHIVVDGVSWRILLADIEQAWQQYQSGQPIVLGPKTSSFQAWGTALAEHAQSLDSERAYWLSQFEQPVAPLPVDTPAEHVTWSTTKTAKVRLDAAQTQALLQRCAPVYRTTINELLLSGVYLGFRKWTGNDGVRVALEGHGREPLFDHLDTTQTVGWFTTSYPLTLSANGDVAGVIKSVKEQYRAIPNNGIGFGLLRHVVRDEQLVAAAKPAEVLFNYLGQLDQSVTRESVLRPASEAMGPAMNVEGLRGHRLGLNGRVSGGVLEFTLDYSALEYRAESMATLAAHIEEGLRSVIEHCLTIERGDFTPSDFPLAKVTQERLDAWQQSHPNLTRLYPATGMQEGMFFHSLLDRGAYVTQIYPTFRGELAAETFRTAWQLVMNRHDIFRTGFVGQNERLHQLVVASIDLPWTEHDWRGLSDDEQRARFAQYREQDKAAGFDMARPPLQRMSLFRLADDRWQMLWTHHHMLLDGWCAPLVYKEVLFAYQRLLEGQPVQLPETPLYENYIQWLSRRDPSEARAYWRETLADVEAPTPLVIDKLPKDARSGFQEQLLDLTSEETRALDAFAKANHTTVNTLMQLAWAYLLHRYSGEANVVFGAITSGRPAEVPGIEQMIGLFINTIPVKVAFAPGAETLSLVSALHRAFQNGQEHSHLPLSDIQKQSAIGAGLPLFESLLAYENYPVDTALQAETKSTALKVEAAGTDERTNYKLTLIVTNSGKLRVRCGYMAEVFGFDAVERMLGHLRTILVELPSRAHIHGIDLVSDAERAQFDAWNDTADADIPTDVCIHQLFVERALQQPQLVAVRDADGAVTYEEVFRRAIALARTLKTLDVQREELVGVRLPKGRGQVIATLGIMMAGAAYLPMETSWPDERCNTIVDVARCRFVVGRDLDLSAIAPAEGELHTLAGELSYDGLPDKLAYVIFTSGSTGTPKGVAIEHAAAVNTLIDCNRRYEVTAADRVLAVSALSFDLSVWDIFGMLAAGGEVIYPAHDKATDPRHWAQLVEQFGITIWDTVPASADLLAQHYEVQGRVSDAPLRSIWMSGDWIHPTLPKRLWTVFPNAKVHSMGGATEGSIWSIHYPVTQDTTGWRSVPYGRAMANQSFHILDAKLREVPVGVIGDLFIGGRGVAREYYADAERTAKSFLMHDRLGRIYRTGDMGRMMPDGNIEFIGRVDHQVKIRGFRIELGEIESVLSQHPEVKEALVEVKGAGNDKYLAAYVLAKDGVTASEALVTGLRQAARAALPAYMHPQAYVILDAFPLTANGKVNKKALPEPDVQAQTEYVAPATETEAKLAAVWRDLLGAQREIGITENFFEAGGNSLLAMQVLYRVEERLGCRLEIADVFSYQTIQLLGKFIDAMTHAELIVEGDVEELEY